jgi:tetratricopeptide (TPR) repeat protein
VQALQAPAVVEIAVSRGAAGSALKFAEEVSDPALRTECQIAWAEAIVRARAEAEPANAPSLSGLFAKLTAADQARLHARLGTIWLARNAAKRANEALQSATTALGKLSAVDEFVIPSMAVLATAPLSNLVPLRLEALALTEMARLEARLGNKDAAWKDVTEALRRLRATGPTQAAANELSKGLSQGMSGLRSKLRLLLKLRNEEQAQTAVNKYRQSIRLLKIAADTRFAYEASVLQAGVSWGHAHDLWTEITVRSSETDLNRVEPFLATSIPWKLADSLEAEGNKELAGTIRQAAGATTPSPRTMLEEFAVRATSTDPHALVKTLQSIANAEYSERLRAALIASGRLARDGKIDEAIQFVRLFEDQLLREDALEWTIALGTRLGFERQVYAHLRAASFVPTEAVSAWRGFLLGMVAKQRSETAASAAGPQQKAEPSSKQL